MAQITHPCILATMRPLPTLLLLFLIIPIIEVVLFIAVGARIGVAATVAVIVLTAVIGSALVSRQGRLTLREAQADLYEGRFPAGPLAHGVMILMAGVLLLTPGFLTDIVGFTLLVPGVREMLRRWAVARFRRDQILPL